MKSILLFGDSFLKSITYNNEQKNILSIKTTPYKLGRITKTLAFKIWQ